MFRYKIQLPHGEIKIPWPSRICFEEVPGAVVEIAKEVGQTQAEVANVKEEQAEQADKVESLESRTQWTDERLERAFERIWAMQEEIDNLKAAVAALMVEEAEEEIEPIGQETEEATTEPAATIIEKPAAESEPAAKKSKSWSFL